MTEFLNILEAKSGIGASKASLKKNETPPPPEVPAGLNFKASFEQSAKDAKTSKMLTQNANQQIVFAQKILLQQLKHQFPGNEFDANKMVESLMGMMQIAQHSQLNETQQQSLNLNKAMINYQIAGLQGKHVAHQSDTFDYYGQNQEMVFSLPPETVKAEIYVYEDGEVTPIYQERIDATPGRHSFIWDGKTMNGTQADHGIYNVFIRAKDHENQTVQADVNIHSEITDIDYSQGSLGVPYAGSIPLFNFNRLVSPYTPAIKGPDTFSNPLAGSIVSSINEINNSAAIGIGNE